MNNLPGPDRPLWTMEAINAWNKKYPPGTPVTLENDRGNIERTYTRSEAWLLGSGHPVVLVEGRSGGYGLNRITPVRKPRGPGKVKKDIKVPLTRFTGDTGETIGGG